MKNKIVETSHTKSIHSNFIKLFAIRSFFANAITKDNYEIPDEISQHVALTIYGKKKYSNN